MKKALYLATALLTGVTAWAAPVTQQAAQSVAQAFLQERRPTATIAPTPVLKSMRSSSSSSVLSDTPYYYIFNTANNQGYVIVSGDDRTTQVLGYTDNGNFDAANIPANMQAWLDSYAEQIAALGDATVPMTLAAAKDTRNSISPLIATRWDQATPYWNHCPQFMNVEDGDTTSELAYTGCVATAMSQVMNYHQWPAQSSQTIPSYSVTYYLGNYQYGTFDTDELPVRAFDWEHMKDTYTGGEAEVYTEAVSWLMLYAGCAAHMQYGTSASSTSDPYIPKALQNYFDYDAQLVYRSDFDQQTWEEMIYQELVAGRPMIYNGRAGSGGGHSFVCDGYAYGDYFHINWGWGGMGDGYFVLSVLNPATGGIGSSTSSEGYNIDQTAIIGIQPGYSGASEEVEHVLTVYNMYSYSKSFDRGDDGSFKLTKRKYIKVTAEDHIDDGTKYKRGIALYDNDGNMVELIASTNYYFSSLSSTDSWPESSSSTTYTFGKGITSGTYKIVPVCQPEGSNEWIPMLESDRYYIAVTFTSSTATFVDHPLNDLAATNFEFTGGEKVGLAEQCNVTVTNNSEDRFSGRLYFYLTNEQIDEYGEYLTVVETEIPAGGTKVVTFNFTPQNAGTKTAQLSIYDSSYGGSKIPGTGNVTIAEGSNSPMNLSVVINAMGADEDMIVWDNYIKFKVDITNNGTGEYTKYVLAPFFIIDDSGAEMVTYQNQSLNLAAGETKTLYFEFDNLSYGSRYALNIYGKNENDSLKNLVGKGESKIYTIQRGMITWTGDGTRTGVKASGAITVPAEAVAVNLEGLTITSVTPNNNPNCLYFVGEDETVPSGLDGKNVIQANAAVSTINLKHGYDYYTPFRFNAASINYEYTFTQGRHAGQQGGWSTMTLPFAATTVTADGETIDWMHSKTDAKALWVCNFAQEEEDTDEGKLYAHYVGATLDANVPYFVAPYDGANGTDMRGKVFVFSANDVTVMPNPSAITSGTYHMVIGKYAATDIDNAYFLNEAGSHFVKATSGTVAAFEAYADNVITSKLAQLEIVLDEDAEAAHGYDLGDVNHDKVVDVQDVTALIAMILGNGEGCEICADVNGDGLPDVQDVTALIAMILGNK